MTDGENVKVQLWRQKDVSGIFLCYRIVGTVPAGVERGGSRLFSADTQINEALVAAHIVPSLVNYPEDKLLDLGASLPQLEQLGLKPRG